MARKINSRLKINGTLVAETPLHVGGYGDSPDTDLPLAQNGGGEWYVPGTSVAGVLRSWVMKNFGQELMNERKLVDEVFGYQNQKGDGGQASFVLVEDATIGNAKDVLVEIRDGVGIDRFYGVAAEGIKYDRAILPRGTRLSFVMTVEIGESHDEQKVKAVIGHLLAALQNREIRFGAARTRGLGRVRLEGKLNENGQLEFAGDAPLSIKEQNFVGFDNIEKLLKGGGDARSIRLLLAAASVSPAAAPRLEINIAWTPRLPVMVKAGYDGIGVDMLPLTSGVGQDKLALCLPGSSIKGVLRSHAGRIVRTLLSDCHCAKGQLFNEQIDALPLVEEIFGARNKSKNETKNSENRKYKSNANARLGLGALAIDDCYAKAEYLMDAKQWRGVEVAGVNNEESYYNWKLWKRLREVDEWKGVSASSKGEDKLSLDEYKEDSKRFRINHHVAIDRWTGGASDGALYSVLAPTRIEWEELSLTLDFGRIEKDSRLPALMLFLLTLRDIAENRVPFGFATNRGMGEIEVNEISFEGNSLDQIGFTNSKGGFAELKEELKKQFSSEDWREWLNNLDK
jgi:CRISPR/Cas system CSM-associated protein Csm3 (group 7 of RAMP superfamily)